MKPSFLFLLTLVLAISIKDAKSQGLYAFCFNGPFYGSASNSSYTTDVFSIPEALVAHPPDASFVDQYTQISLGGDPTDSFRKMLVDRFGVSTRVTSNGVDADNTVCNVYSSRIAAAAGLRRQEDLDRELHHAVTRTSWVYAPSKQGTHTGGTKATEAEALYDAENFPGPFDNTGNGPIGYKTIHRWDKHTCVPTQVTGAHGSNKPETWYKCTITFSYSDDKTPVARATFGTGDTQDDAVASAKSLARTSMLTNVQWSQPFCSSFNVAVKNPYKADYGHGSAKKERLACEIDFTGKN